MTLFAGALDRLFTHPALAVPAVWISATTSAERPIRVIRKAPDQVTSFGAARLVSDTMSLDVRLSDLPEPRPGDLIVIGADSFLIEGAPIRDRERLLWTVTVIPA